MADQATTQSMIQNLLGAQTQGQSISGENANNGNPNTIYNQPSVPGEPAIGGPAPNQWVASPGTILAPGQPVDPYAAVRPTNLQAGSNSLVNDILNRMRSGNFGITPNPSGPAPGTTGPGTGNPNPTPNQPGYTPPGGGLRPDQIGPISGPIANNPHDWRGNYNNAMPGTSPRPGSGYNSLPWMQYTPPTGQGGAASANANIPDWLRNLGNRAMQEVRSGAGDTSSWQQILDIISEPFIPGDWYNSQTGQWNGPMEASGLSDIIGMFSRGGDGQQVDPASIAQALTNMANTRNNITQQFMDRMGNQAANSITANQLRALYPQMSQQEFQQVMNRINQTAAWNSMWDQGRAGDIGQQLGRQAEAWDAQMRNRWTRMR